MLSKLRFGASTTPRTMTADVPSVPIEEQPFSKDETLVGLKKYLLYRRGFSPASVEGFTTAARYMIEKYNIRYPGKNDDLIIKENMLRQKLSPHTINLKLYCMEYLADYQHQDDPAYRANPVRYKKLAEPRNNRKLRWLSISQGAELLHTAYDRSRRDYTIVATFLYAGTRNTETCDMNTGDIDFVKKYLWVKGKGRNGEVESVIMTPVLEPILDEWLEHRPAISSPALFMSCNQNRFTRNTMRALVRNIGEDADLRDENDKHIYVTPHMLRHTCGSSIIKSGGTVLDVKRQLRHRQLSTTVDTYLHGDDETTRKNISKLKY